MVLEALPMYQRTHPSRQALSARHTRRTGATVRRGHVNPHHRTLAISHQAQFPAVSLSNLIAVPRGDAVDAVKSIETRIGMPGSIVGVFAGDAAGGLKSLAGQPWLILAALVTSTSCSACS